MAFIEQIVWSVPSELYGVEILSVKNNQRPWPWCIYHTYSIWIHHNPSRMLMLLEPGEVYRTMKTAPPCDFSAVMIDPIVINGIASEVGKSPNPHFRECVATDPRLYDAFTRFHAALAEQTTLLHRQSLLVDCIRALITGYCEDTPRPTPRRQRLLRARDFLAEHFSEKITLAQLAQISGLSRYYFLRVFTREFGLPPHRYQMCLRIEEVRRMLRNGIPCAMIEAGFADESHMIRHFKALAGVTPAKYTAMVTTARTIRTEVAPRAVPVAAELTFPFADSTPG